MSNSYCSLPLCRILTAEELSAIVGHELGYFKGFVQLHKNRCPLCSNPEGLGVSHDFCHGLGGPFKGMRILVPWLNMLIELNTQIIDGSKICDFQAFALEDAEPQFDIRSLEARGGRKSCALDAQRSHHL